MYGGKIIIEQVGIKLTAKCEGVMDGDTDREFDYSCEIGFFHSRFPRTDNRFLTGSRYYVITSLPKCAVGRLTSL